MPHELYHISFYVLTQYDNLEVCPLLMQMTLFHYFYGCVIFHCIYVSQLHYLFFCWWKFRLLPCLCYYKLHCNGHWDAYVLSDHLFLQVYAQESGIARSHGSYISSFLRKLHIILYNSCIDLHRHSVGGFPSLYTLTSIYYLWVFFDDSPLTAARWYSMVVFFCSSLIINDVEQLFICLLAICVSSLEKYLFRSSAHVLMGLFVLMILYWWARQTVLILNELTVQYKVIGKN